MCQVLPLLFLFFDKYCTKELDNGQSISQNSRTTHISDNSAQNNFRSSAQQGVFCTHTSFRHKDFPKSSIFRSFPPVFALQATLALLLGAIFLLVSCDPPKSSTPPTTVTGTVQDQTTKAELSGVTVSALKSTTVSGPDGKFTLQVRHSGKFRKFKLALKSTCYNPLTTPDITAKGSHNAGLITLTAKPEPTGTARYTFTPKGPPADKKFTLTVNCVREIRNNEFNTFITGGIILRKATAEGLTALEARNMVTEISLPRTLTKIGDGGLLGYSLIPALTIPNNVETIGSNALTASGVSLTPGMMISFESNSRLKTIGNNAFESSILRDFSLPENLETIGKQAFRITTFKFGPTVPKTFIIPAKVANIYDQAFAALGTHGLGITTVEILSEELAKPAGASRPFPLGDNLFQNIRGITEIKLPQAVHDSYTAAERTTIFGSIPLKPR